VQYFYPYPTQLQEILQYDRIAVVFYMRDEFDSEMLLGIGCSLERLMKNGTIWQRKKARLDLN